VSTWMAPTMQALLERHLPADWRTRVDDPSVWEAVARIPDEQLWDARCTLRTELVHYAREQSIRDRLSRGEPADYVEAADRVFDPHVLTLGFARRVATYKRLHLITRQLDRGLRLLADHERPIQLVIAGKAHPQDDDAKHTLAAVFGARRAPEVGARIIFLEDYDLRMAPRLVAGADVWVNLPRPPLEASGTSGMKAAVNGGLNLSVLDGWWAEVNAADVGWAIETPDGDPQAQDDHDAATLFDLLEQRVIPLFYDRGSDGIPHRWLGRVKASMAQLIPRFSADRMLRHYLSTLYTSPVDAGTR
jgi:glycogen phosphorylase